MPLVRRFAVRSSLLAVTLLRIPSAPLVAQPPPWRLFWGSFNTSWRSTVFHAHTEDCRTRICELSDFETANLDRSIGFRAGAERPVWRRGPLELFGGGEVGVVHTEYNLSQRDVTLGELFAAAGLRFDLRLARLDLRVGAGGAAQDDGIEEFASFTEIAAEVPLGGGTALRLAGRRANHGGPESEDFSVLLVAGAEPSSGASGWDYGWSFGVSQPGMAVGGSLALSSAPFSRFSLHRGLGGQTRLGLSYLTTAHESRRRTSFYYGVPGNERGRTIHGLLLGVDWERKAWGNMRWRSGAGVEVASWADDYGLLLSERDEPVRAGVEAAAVASLEGVLPLRKGMRLVVGAEQLYWFGIRLGELRFRSGVEISP